MPRSQQTLLAIHHEFFAVRSLHDDDGVERDPIEPTSQRQRVPFAYLWPLIGVVNLQLIHWHLALSAIVAGLYPVIPLYLVDFADFVHSF
jgi:hypothetical protein